MCPFLSFLPPRFPTNPSHLSSIGLVGKKGTGRRWEEAEGEVPAPTSCPGKSTTPLPKSLSMYLTEHEVPYSP